MSRKNKGRRAAEFRDINARALYIDRTYQRDTDPTRVKKIVDHFDPNLVNIVKVSFRNGRYYVFDGGHTLAALKQVNGGDNFLVSCKVFYGLTYEQEAELFAMQTGFSKKVGEAYRIRALEAAGDEEIIDFLERTREAGFTIEPAKRMNRTGGIDAVAKAHELYGRVGPETYSRTLELLWRTWSGEKFSVSQNMLGGMGVVMKVYGDEINESRFVKKLGTESAESIRREASKQISMSPANACALAIMKAYNKGGAKGTVDLSKLTVKA